MIRMMKRIVSVTLLLSIFCCSSLNIGYTYNDLLSGIKNSDTVIDGMQFYDVVQLGNNYWAREAIYTMAALGIVKGYEEGRFAPSEFVTRSQSLALIYRAISLEDQANAYANVLAERKKDNPGTINNIDSWADGYIQLAYNNGLINNKQYQDAMRFNQEDLQFNEFRKSSDATRQEIVLWIAKALNIAPVNNSNYAVMNSFADVGLVDKEIAPYFESVLNAQIVKGSNGYLFPDRAITREEMAQILLNCKSYIMKEMGITEYSSIINSLPNNNTIICTRDYGFEEYIVLQQNEGLVVIGTERIGGVGLLRQQDKIKYYVNNRHEVILVYVSSGNEPDSSVGNNTLNSYVTSGVVQNINISASTLTLYDESGRTSSAYYRNFSLANGFSIKVLKNNVPTSLDDIYPQDKVFLKIENGIVSEISFSRTSIDIFGTLKYKTDNVFDVIKDDGQTQRFTINSGSSFYEKNSKVRLDNIIVGSKVKVSAYKNSDQYVISRVEIQTDYNINNIYRAVIDSYDSTNSKLVVKDLMKMERNFWGYTAQKGYVEFQLSDSSNAFYNNERVMFSDFNNYKEMEIYIATEVGLDGGDRVAFARINSYVDNRSLVHSGQIKNVYSSSSKLEIDKFYYSFNTGNGTIFVKNGKLVTINEIAQSDNVYLVASGNGTFYNTFVVYVDESNVLGDYEIYFADILRVDIGEQINVQTYRLYDINKGDWIYSSRKLTFRINNNTRIFDNNGIVNNRYLTSISREDYVTADIVVSNGEAIAISLGKGSRFSMKARVGSVTKNNNSVEALHVYDARQYLSSFDEWDEAEGGEINLLSNTIYMKNGKLIFASDVKEGDRVTIFYNGINVRTALIVYVE